MDIGKITFGPTMVSEMALTPFSLSGIKPKPPSFIAPITPRQALNHFKALDSDGRYMRFCQNMSDEQLEKYTSTAKGNFYGVLHVGDVVPVSVVHFARISDCPHWLSLSKDEQVAEVGFSTLKGSQGNGYARMLMYFVKGLAEVSCVDTLVMSGLGNNKAIQKIAKEAGFKVEVQYGEFEAELKTFRSVYQQLGQSMIQLIRSPFDASSSSN